MKQDQTFEILAHFRNIFPYITWTYIYYIPLNMLYVLPSGLRCEVLHSPVDERVSHCSCDGAGLRFTQSEDALDDGQLSARGVQSAESTPVVHHHTSSDHLATTIDRSSLGTGNSTLIN